MLNPTDAWAELLGRVSSIGSFSPGALAVCAWTYEVVLASGDVVRSLEPDEAYSVVEALSGTDLASIKAGLLSAATTAGGRSPPEEAKRVRDLLASFPDITRVADPRARSSDEYLRNRFRGEDVPPMRELPRAEFAWSELDVRAFPFLRRVSDRWDQWRVHHQPTTEQLYRKMLAELYPTHRAAAHLGQEFVTGPTTEYVRCVGSPITSSAEYGRRMGPYLMHLWKTRDDPATDPAEALFAFIVTGDPAKPPTS